MRYKEEGKKEEGKKEEGKKEENKKEEVRKECLECKKPTKSLYRTVIYNPTDDSVKLVEFCTIKCFENYSFPKWKKQRK